MDTLITISTIATFALTLLYLILWKDFVMPWLRKRKGWKSLEIHPLHSKELDTPSDQEWLVGGFVMTSNDREFLIEFFLGDVQRVNNELQTPIDSPRVKANSVIIGYKLTHYPECPQNQRHLISKNGVEYGSYLWWELAVSESYDNWATILKNRKVNVSSDNYQDFLLGPPSPKQLKAEKKAFRKKWKNRRDGKSDEW